MEDQQNIPKARLLNRPKAIYTTWRVLILLPDRGNEKVLAQSVYSDPFTSTLWIGRAHIEGERSLAQKLSEEHRVDVWLLPYKESGMARRISVEFARVRACPIDLDCRTAEVALDWVALEESRYSFPVDVPAEEQPEPVRSLGQRPPR